MVPPTRSVNWMAPSKLVGCGMSVLGGAVVTMRRLSTIPREAEEADGADGLAKSPSQLARGSRAREPRRSARDLQTSRAKGGGSS
jgi:hypothetical protein